MTEAGVTVEVIVDI